MRGGGDRFLDPNPKIAVQRGRGLARVRGGQCLSHHAPLVELARPSMNVAKCGGVVTDFWIPIQK